MAPKLVSGIGIIGLGLIGGSFARALKLNNSVDIVLGFDIRKAEMDTAVRLNVIDVACDSIEDLVVKSQVIVLAAPVKAVEPILRNMAPHITEQHIITDMGSVKGAVIDIFKVHFNELMPRFVPGHPIAGSEKSGVAASDPALFQNHKTILTPSFETGSDALDTVEKLWRSVGAKVLMMSPARHDEVLALTSHLPHLIAFSLVDTLAGSSENKDIFRYAAGGFRDFTRIAASDPVMWHDIYLSNRQAVLNAVDEFSEDLKKLRRAIDVGDGDALLGVFTRARAAREHFGRMLEGKRYTPANFNFDTTLIVDKASPLKGDVHLEGDRSISHRAIVLGALATGVTRIEGFPESEASLATIQAFRDMGVIIEGPDRGHVVIHGVGLHGLQPPPGPLYVGHSDTSLRLLAGVMSGQRFSSEIIADSSQDHKSMHGIAEALVTMGAIIQIGDDGLPPLVVKGPGVLKAKEFTLDDVNAELKSCLLFAACYAEGETRIKEVNDTRDHTERLLAGFGYPVQFANGLVEIGGGDEITARNIDVPADFTLAFYYIVAATLTPGSELTLRNVGINKSRISALTVLQAMGAHVEVLNSLDVVNEKIADLKVYPSALTGFKMGAKTCLQASEEMPALLIAASLASSASRIKGFSLLPEDLQSVLLEVSKAIVAFGGLSRIDNGELVITPISKVTVKQNVSAPDHAGGALACIVLGNCFAGSTRVMNCGSLFRDYPLFVEQASGLGFKISH